MSNEEKKTYLISLLQNEDIVSFNAFRCSNSDFILEINKENFEGKNLSGAILANSLISDCNFDETDCSNAIFLDTTLIECTFYNSLITNGCFGTPILIDSAFSDVIQKFSLNPCKLDKVIFRGADLSFSGFRDCSVSNSDFGYSMLKNVDFKNCLLVNCIFEQAICENTLFDSIPNDL